MNVHAKLREGWEPVRADEYPELKGRYPTIEDGQHAGVIGVGGLMLARIPEETVEEEKSSEPKISKKEKAATQIVKKIDDKARYDDAAQTKTLIVMQILGNTKTFFDSQSFIQDTNLDDYLNKTIEDQYGMLFNMAQDNTLQEMIDAQY